MPARDWNLRPRPITSTPVKTTTITASTTPATAVANSLPPTPVKLHIQRSAVLMNTGECTGVSTPKEQEEAVEETSRATPTSPSSRPAVKKPTNDISQPGDDSFMSSQHTAHLPPTPTSPPTALAAPTLEQLASPAPDNKGSLQHHLAEITQLFETSATQELKYQAELAELRASKRKSEIDLDELRKRTRLIVLHDNHRMDVLKKQIDNLKTDLDAARVFAEDTSTQLERERREIMAEAEEKVKAEREKWTSQIALLQTENDRLSKDNVLLSGFKARFRAFSRAALGKDDDEEEDEGV